MGGAGCFGRPIEICSECYPLEAHFVLIPYPEIISMLLNDGVNPGNGKRLLKRETVTGIKSSHKSIGSEQTNHGDRDVHGPNTRPSAQL